MNQKVVVVCEDSFDGIMCGVYHAWEVKLRQQKTGKVNVGLIAGEQFNYEFFSEYQVVKTDLEVSGKVVNTIRKKLGHDAYIRTYRGAMSSNERKADIIFRFLIDAFRIGPGIGECLSFPSVMDLYELDRNVMNEQHHYLGFVRFSELENKALVSIITPKNNILTLIAPHFSDRLSMENWIIYDKNRKTAALHVSGRDWALVSNEEIDENISQMDDEQEREIKDLWKLFFHTIAIKERVNPKLQRSNLPLRFRDRMTEWE